MNEMLNRITNIDCREGIININNNSISLILTDPPYFIDGMDNNWNNEKIKARIKQGVIGGLPSGMKFDINQGRKLYKFLIPICREWKRIMKPGGFALCFSQARLVHHTAMAMEDAGFEIRDMIAWKYEGQPKAFTQDHFVKRRKDITEQEKSNIIKKLNGRKTPQLKPQMELIVLGQKPKEGTFVDNWIMYNTGLIDVNKPLVMQNKFPGNVIPVNKTRRKSGEIITKPILLLRHLIRIFLRV